eukprot:6182204-Pleurochrysis_carterae.AAC.2
MRNEQQLKHVQEMLAERMVINNLENKAQRSFLTALCVNDKMTARRKRQHTVTGSIGSASRETRMRVWAIC